MPMYSYVCEKCQTQFEAFASIQKKESGWKPDCPRCGSSQTRQTFGAVGLIHLTRQNSPRGEGGCCSPQGG